MKNISREFIAGSIAIITIVVFIWLFSFLKGNNLFNSNNRYYAIYNDIGGLAESSPVEISGYKAGIVRDIDYINDGTGRLLVSIGINKNYELPLGTVAQIKPETVLAGMKISLKMGSSDKYHLDGDTLVSLLDKGLINNLSNDLSPLITRADRVISDIDTLLDGMKPLLNSEFSSDLKESASNLNNTSKNLDNLLEKSGKEIEDLITNIEVFTAVLKTNSSSMDSTIKNVSKISEELAGNDLGSSVKNLNDALDGTKDILKKINDEEGSAGLLLNDDSLYNNLTRSLEQLNILLEDMKTNPGRYVNFSLFGRKKNK
ncbi:MAG TPA: MlaD family protein [Bacteroidales bacterium]|nr:MlaD family protein [Bacteroidales bacterium]